MWSPRVDHVALLVGAERWRRNSVAANAVRIARVPGRLASSPKAPPVHQVAVGPTCATSKPFVPCPLMPNPSNGPWTKFKAKCSAIGNANDLVSR